jgi:hypothetical protein
MKARPHVRPRQSDGGHARQTRSSRKTRSSPKALPSPKTLSSPKALSSRPERRDLASRSGRICRRTALIATKAEDSNDAM